MVRFYGFCNMLGTGFSSDGAVRIFSSIDDRNDWCDADILHRIPISSKSARKFMIDSLKNEIDPWEFDVVYETWYEVSRYASMDSIIRMYEIVG